ncbi:unnamed protein product [Fraxinus pennsylvanica]|uniref:Bromo domain-containing protein n=1 Tax=Fraxinus pennsylvanica TaxID=56036 RepID=A0AAD2DNU8_9LAMI|nr:unnamed protein product [Fraxinus pennsylvanica]
MRQILTKLMKHKNGWIFNKPVDAAALGLHDYHQIVKQPMDLDTVKSNMAIMRSKTYVIKLTLVAFNITSSNNNPGPQGKMKKLLVNKRHGAPVGSNKDLKKPCNGFLDNGNLEVVSSNVQLIVREQKGVKHCGFREIKAGKEIYTPKEAGACRKRKELTVVLATTWPCGGAWDSGSGGVDGGSEIILRIPAFCLNSSGKMMKIDFSGLPASAPLCGDTDKLYNEISTKCVYCDQL